MPELGRQIAKHVCAWKCKVIRYISTLYAKLGGYQLIIDGLWRLFILFLALGLYDYVPRCNGCLRWGNPTPKSEGLGLGLRTFMSEGSTRLVRRLPWRGWGFTTYSPILHAELWRLDNHGCLKKIGLQHCPSISYILLKKAESSRTIQNVLRKLASAVSSAKMQ